MSYNITNWTTKELKELVIPLKALYNISDDLIKRGWQPSYPKCLAFDDDGKVIAEIAGFGQATAQGKLWKPEGKADHVFAVSDICVYGEGSGTFFLEILKPALEQSMGYLEAVLIWEGGDSISRLICDDGEITEKNIEL